MQQIQILPYITEAKPGDKQKLTVRGTTLDFNSTLKDLYIPSDYVSFSSTNDEYITINENGEFIVNPEIKEEDVVGLTATYKDPITGEAITDTTVVNVILDEEELGGEDPQNQNESQS